MSSISPQNRLNLYLQTLQSALYLDHTKSQIKMREINVPIEYQPSCVCREEEWKEKKSHEWYLVRKKAKGWIRKANGKVVARQIQTKRDGASWNNLPMELKEIIWGLVVPATGRVHEIIPDPKQRRRPERQLNRMVMRSNNTTVPSMLHVSKEWRAKALEIYQLCQYKPAIPHPACWKVEHTCVRINPFYFNKELDTLYLSKSTAEWLAYAWARADAIWVDNLFAGWRHVGLDFRSPSWIGRTPSYTTAPMQTVFSKQPAILFREMFPQLQKLSIVIDLSETNCPNPLENNTSLHPTFHAPESWIIGHCIVSLWGMFLRTEYAEHELPKVDFQEVWRKKETVGWSDRWIRFYVKRLP